MNKPRIFPKSLEGSIFKMGKFKKNSADISACRNNFKIAV